MSPRTRCTRPVLVAALAAAAFVPLGLVTPARAAPAPVPAAAGCVRYSVDTTIPVARCASGWLVRDIQIRLDRVLPHGMSVDGYFGPATESAVKYFQHMYGLTQDGIVGPITYRRLLDATRTCSTYTDHQTGAMRLCQRGQGIAEAQRLLNAALPQLPRLAVDGYFGRQTWNTVVYFQREHGLVIDGIIGPATWDALTAANR